MLRQWHALPGLVLALVLFITCGTGAILAFDALREDLTAPQATNETLSLADLADRVAEHFPTVERITRTPSGRVRVTSLNDGRPTTTFIDPATALPTEADSVSPLLRTITNLHRAWLSGDGGRLAAGGAALAMLLLVGTGLVLLKRQNGGWLGLARPFRGTGARRWHTEIGRIAAAGLTLSSVTAIELSLVGFEIVPDGTRLDDVMISASGGPRLPPAQLQGLASLALADLREITFPDPSDTTDPITVKTHRATRLVDPATGDILREEPHTFAWHVRDLAFRLHTAEGAAGLALLLGLSAASGSALALTGLVFGLRKRLRSSCAHGSVAASDADVLLLVGSEGGTTYRFAETLLAALNAAGQKVHLAAMNDAPASSPARQMILLAATAGAGDAPASATRFLDKLSHWPMPKPDTLVLGFGDASFPTFCAYADRLEAALVAQGFPLAMATTRIDRQSPEAFAAWGERLGEILHLPLRLEHREKPVALHRFELVEREDHGIEVQALTSILRFRIVPPYRGLPMRLQQALGLLPSFEPGDLVAITPPGDARPRYYSIASSSGSGVLELCVRHQPGGLCSGYLCGLQDGAGLAASIVPNPAFRPDTGKTPLILIGAGAGIAPLIGFLRQSAGKRPVHLYWGGRSPTSDFLYRDELEDRLSDGTLTGLHTIFSRHGRGGYVQDLLAQDAPLLRSMVEAGGQILICGGCDMAEGVARALGHALSPAGVDLPSLRHNGRLLEDVY